MVHGVSVVWLPVSDMDQAVKFYGETLGLSVREQQDEWAELEANGLRIGLNGRKSASGDGGAVIAFQPDGGLDGAVAELKDSGVEFVGDISEHPWGRIAAFEDPDGNSLQLFEPPAG